MHPFLQRWLTGKHTLFLCVLSLTSSSHTPKQHTHTQKGSLLLLQCDLFFIPPKREDHSTHTQHPVVPWILLIISSSSHLFCFYRKSDFFFSLSHNIMSSSTRRGGATKEPNKKDSTAAAAAVPAPAAAAATTPSEEALTDGDNHNGTENETTTAPPLPTPGTSILAGMTAPLPSRENYRTVYWSAADKRFDQLQIDQDFTFDDDTQTIAAICDRPIRHFPNTHFMRRVAGHLKLGLGRNATKEAILEKICAVHYGPAFTRPVPTSASSSSATTGTAHGDGTSGGSGSGSKRKAGTDQASSSTLLKKRPVVMNRSSSSSKRGGGNANAADAVLKSRATALQAWSVSLDSISNAIRQTEQRLQSLCQATDDGLDFYVVLMDRTKITHKEYLQTQFAEYDHLLELQKQMIASMTQLGQGGGGGNTNSGDDTTTETLNPVRAAQVAAQAMAAATTATGSGSTTTSPTAATIAAAETDPVEV
jgi:hypothetical protein